MALRNHDPFASISPNVKSKNNPYVDFFRVEPDDSIYPIFYGSYLKEKAGTWRSLFPNPDAPLYLEIGCHLGKTLCDMATDHPEINFIGIDITFKRVATAAKRAVDKNLTNIQTALFNAVFLDQLFAENELDGIFVFFPDPWSKSRKAKHRLIKRDFLRQVQKVVKPRGFLWLKTDQKPYFEEACELIDAEEFRKIASPSGILTETYETTFERKFRLQGFSYYQGQWHPSSRER